MPRSKPKKTPAWLRDQIAAAASKAIKSKSPLAPLLTNQDYLKCSRAIYQLARVTDGQPLTFPSRALPPLP